MTAIQIGNNVTNIMKLSCVFSCHKIVDGELEYLLYDWDEQGQYVRAHKGDWIVEEDGKHYVLTDKEYEKIKKNCLMRGTITSKQRKMLFKKEKNILKNT